MNCTEEALQDPSGLDPIPVESLDPRTTPYDYIVVGSGAGGGPVASRLARSGMKVLVVEAGLDPGARQQEKREGLRTAENQRLIYHCPGLHAAATEPHRYMGSCEGATQTSWGFQVRHYSATTTNDFYYPRASALGGCTAHHAMITIYGADYDWQRIANLTGDDSWASGKMRAIYQRIERVRYGVWQTKLLSVWDWFLGEKCISQAESGSAWLDVRITDPKLAMSDARLMKVIVQTIFDEEGLSNTRRLWRWLKRALTGRLFRDLDLNDEDTMRESPEGAALVPIGVSRHGVRRGPRELLLETRQTLLKEKRRRVADPDPFAGELYISTGVFVRRILFSGGTLPRAIGIECQRGRHLYDRSDGEPQPVGDRFRVFARREIIISAGAFNTPQLLMLSGIGNKADLQALGVKGLPCISNATDLETYQPIVNLPGVGENLLDRCEISVITEMNEPFESLNGVQFDPNAHDDPALNAWKAEHNRRARSGIYTTNGAAIAILKRSHPSVFQPDLLMFGFPVAFRGYYEGWSKDLLAREPGDKQKSRSLWSWLILKAYSANCGSVRLRHLDPYKAPEINFRYFGDCCDSWQIDKDDDDLAALQYAVRYVRRLNRKARKLLKHGDSDAAEVQPGSGRRDGSDELKKWIIQQTWGHHAAGTCRIGSDPWNGNTADLRDKSAVLDSKLRVHGVRGLRVVDASVFPTIPGYFIAVPIYMVGEKASDMILDELSI